MEIERIARETMKEMSSSLLDHDLNVDQMKSNINDFLWSNLPANTSIETAEAFAIGILAIMEKLYENPNYLKEANNG